MRTISMTLLPWVVTPVVLVALTLSGLAHANPQRAQLQANFQAADVDRNEQLNLAEFKTFINLNADHKLGRSASVRRFGMYTTAFKEIDANGDGVITKEEIAAQTKQQLPAVHGRYAFKKVCNSRAAKNSSLENLKRTLD